MSYNPTRLPLTPCPKCGNELDACSHLEDDDARPGEGDLTVCLRCAAILIFEADLTQRLATDEELAGLADEPRAELERVRAVCLRRIFEEAARWN